MNFAAGKFRPFEQFRADITKLLGAAQTFQQQSSALLELLRSQPPAHRAARITRAAAIFAALAAFWPAISSGGRGDETSPHSVRPDNSAARHHARVAASAILLGVWRNSSGAHRSLALVRSSKSQWLRRAARRVEVETKSILSRLAHHRRHRLWQNQFRHQPTGASSFSKRTDIGVVCALTKRAFIGKRSRRWRVTTAANTI